MDQEDYVEAYILFPRKTSKFWARATLWDWWEHLKLSSFICTHLLETCPGQIPCRTTITDQLQECLSGLRYQGSKAGTRLTEYHAQISVPACIAWERDYQQVGHSVTCYQVSLQKWKTDCTTCGEGCRTILDKENDFSQWQHTSGWPDQGCKCQVSS